MNILVTGAGNGIGFQTVLALAASGDNRVLALSRNMESLEKLKRQALEQKGSGEVLIFKSDISSISADGLLEFLSSHNIHHLDGLINNAGHLVNRDFEKLTDADFQLVYETNVFAPVRLIRFLLPLLRKSAHAHILNISSLGGFQGSSKFKGLSAYSSSKAALACLTECMAVEFQDDPISVNALALGAVDTEMLQQAFPGYQAPVSAAQMGRYVAGFIADGHQVYNGKILPVSLAAI